MRHLRGVWRKCTRSCWASLRAVWAMDRTVPEATARRLTEHVGFRARRSRLALLGVSFGSVQSVHSRRALAKTSRGRFPSRVEVEGCTDVAFDTVCSRVCCAQPCGPSRPTALPARLRPRGLRAGGRLRRGPAAVAVPPDEVWGLDPGGGCLLLHRPQVPRPLLCAAQTSTQTRRTRLLESPSSERVTWPREHVTTRASQPGTGVRGNRTGSLKQGLGQNCGCSVSARASSSLSDVPSSGRAPDYLSVAHGRAPGRFRRGQSCAKLP